MILSYGSRYVGERSGSQVFLLNIVWVIHAGCSSLLCSSLQVEKSMHCYKTFNPMLLNRNYSSLNETLDIFNLSLHLTWTTIYIALFYLRVWSVTIFSSVLCFNNFLSTTHSFSASAAFWTCRPFSIITPLTINYNNILVIKYVILTYYNLNLQFRFKSF